MIDKEKRNKEINETFENKFTRLLEQCKGQEGWQLFVDTIITQELNMIEKLEADKAELLEALKNIRFMFDYGDYGGYGSNAKISAYDALIQKMEK